MALAGSDNLFSAAPGVTVVGGDDDDVIATGQHPQSGQGGPVRIFAGSGNDTVHGWFDDARIFGGPGNDTIAAGPGKVFVAPGSGADTVSSADGNDTFVINAECEATAGKNLAAGGGNDTLVTPLTAAQLASRGVTISGFENVVVQSNVCNSDCVARPDCGPLGRCADVGGQAICEILEGGGCSDTTPCASGLSCVCGTCQSTQQSATCPSTCTADDVCALAQRLPSGVSPFEVALLASQNLVVEAGATIVGNPGASPPLLVNMGQGKTEIGAGAVVGSIWSNAPVLLHASSSTQGYVASSRQVNKPAGASVIGAIRANQALSPTVHEWVFKVVPGSADVVAESGVTELVPGAYRRITVGDGASLRLAPGRYDLDTLIVAAGGSVETGPAATFVNVKTGLQLDGTVLKSAGPGEVGMLMSYLGTADLILSKHFEGALFSKSPVRLEPIDSLTFRGSISASDIFIGAHVRLEYLPFVSPDLLVPDYDFSVELVGGEVRPTSSREQPLEVTADNPFFTGTFVFEPEISATKSGDYSHEYEWFGLDDAHLTTHTYFLDSDTTPRRVHFAGLPYSGRPLPSSPGFPTEAKWHFRGTQQLHGNTQVLEASMTPAGVSRTLRHAPLWTRLSDSVIVVPVVIVAWEMPQQPAEAAEKARRELKAAIDFLPTSGEAQLHYTRGSAVSPTSFRGVKMVPPDDIFSQCGVQLRVIGSYVLARPAGPQIGHERCASQSHSFVDKVEDIYSAIEAVNPGSTAKWFSPGALDPIIVQTGPLICSNYYGNTIPNDNTIELATRDWPGSNSTTLAHELGHAFGLFHRGGDAPEALMDAGPGDASRLLNEAECNTIRERVSGFRGRLHDYDVDRQEAADDLFSLVPGPWLSVPNREPPPMVCCESDGQVSRTDRFACALRGGDEVSAAECQVCCAVIDPAIFGDPGQSFTIQSVSPEACEAERVLELDACHHVCCVHGDDGTMMTRYQCLADNPSTGYSAGRIATESEVDHFCPSKPPG